MTKSEAEIQYLIAEIQIQTGQSAGASAVSLVFAGFMLSTQDMLIFYPIVFGLAFVLFTVLAIFFTRLAIKSRRELERRIAALAEES